MCTGARVHACAFMYALCVCCSTGNAIRETIEFSTDRLVLVSRQNANRSIQDLFAHFEQRFDQLMQDEHFVDPSIASPQKLLLLWPIEFLPPRAHYEEVCFDTSVHKKCTNDETSSCQPSRCTLHPLLLRSPAGSQLPASFCCCCNKCRW